MTGSPAYQATKVNGNRFFKGNTETWIKIETVSFDVTAQAYVTQDITEDILALGVTQAAPNNSSFSIADTNYNTNGIDSRSIIKLQRYAVDGPNISDSSYISTVGTYNYVIPGTVATSTNCNNGSDALTTSGYDTGTITGAPTYFPGNFGGDDRSDMR